MIHFVLGRRSFKNKVETLPQEVFIYKSLISPLQITVLTLNYNNAQTVVLALHRARLACP
jgi:hypothetical protein